MNSKEALDKICAATHSIIKSKGNYNKTETVVCNLCKACYSSEFEQTLCRVCEVSQIGVQKIGLRLLQ